MVRVIGDIGEIGETPQRGRDLQYALSGDEGGRPYFSSCDRLDAFLQSLSFVLFLFYFFCAFRLSKSRFPWLLVSSIIIK